MEEMKSDFKYSVDRMNKKGTMTFIGFITQELSETFQKAYSEIKTCCKNGTLCLDTSKMLPFPQEVANTGGDIYVDYSENFSKILFLLPENVVAKAQMKRMLKEKNIIDKFTFVTQL